MVEDIFQNNDERYTYYRFVETGEWKVQERKKDGEVVKVRVPVLKRMKVDFEDVKNISLDRHGVNMPTYEQDFTLIHNYLYDFWQPILGSETVACYTLLKRYAYGKKDYCYPDMDTIAYKLKKSRNTVLKYLETLEQYGFVVRIWRKDREKNNGDASPIFKIRRFTPLLSEDLIDELPDEIKKEHDRYMADIQGVTLNETTDADKVIENIIKNSEEIINKKKHDSQEITKSYIVQQMTSEENKRWIGVLEELQSRISKPSFDTWFRDTVIVVNDNSISVLCPSAFSAEWIRDRYEDVIKNIVMEKYGLDIKFSNVDLYGRYIKTSV